MKFLYMYCTHIRGRNPINRTGSFFEDIKAKIRESLELAQERNVDAIIHGGDWGESPVLALNLVDEIVDMIEEYGIPWYIIRGNHDEIGHNPNLSGQSILDHIFRRSDLIFHLGGIADAWANDKVTIHGYDYYHNVENDLKENGLFVPNKIEGYRNIAVTHSYIMEKPFFKEVSHILAKDLKTDYDLVLLSHYHSAQGIFKVGNTTFVGIGALARQTVGKGDLSSHPSVLFVDTIEPKMEIIPLKSVRPAEEAFNLEILELMKNSKANLDDFVMSLDSVEVQGLGVRDAVERICNENKVEKAIKDKIIDKIFQIQGERDV